MDLDQVGRGTWSLDMDKPADPETPFAQVYQAFLDDLALEGTKATTIRRYRYDIVRFEKWLVANGHPATLASLERTILFGYRQFLESLPQQRRGSHRRRRGGLMSNHTVHSYLRSIKCLASWLKGAGRLPTKQFEHARRMGVRQPVRNAEPGCDLKVRGRHEGDDSRADVVHQALHDHERCWISAPLGPTSEYAS
jgi:hypothetical protein